MPRRSRATPTDPDQPASSPAPPQPSEAASAPAPAEEYLSLPVAARRLSLALGLRISYRSLYQLLHRRSPPVPLYRRRLARRHHLVWVIRASDLPILEAHYES